MNRPAVLRQLEGRVTGRAVTPYRVRAPDVVRLVEYVRHLEGRTKVRPARAGTPLDADERMLGDDPSIFVHRADCDGQHEGDDCPLHVEVSERLASGDVPVLA